MIRKHATEAHPCATCKFEELARSAYYIACMLGASGVKPGPAAREDTLPIMRAWLEQARAFEAEYGGAFAALGRRAAKFRNGLKEPEQLRIIREFEALVQRAIESLETEVQR